MPQILNPRLSQSAWPGYIPYALSDADAKSDCSVEDVDQCDVVWPGTDEEHEAPVRPPAAASGSSGSQELTNVQRERDRATMGEKVIVGQGAPKWSNVVKQSLLNGLTCRKLTLL